MQEFEGTSDAIILVKASPQFGKHHGETVCCAGVDEYANWVRLYPVTFRNLDDAQQFGRWDKVRYKWTKPANDPRPESRRIDHQAIEIIGRLKDKERVAFLDRTTVTSLDAVRASGKSLALLRPKNPRFIIEEKSDEDIVAERARNAGFANQQDLFAKKVVPLEPCPYRFKYAYETDDGARTGTCQDWETDATFYWQERRYGRKAALDYMQRTFGEDYPAKGMALAMGTHSQYPDTWLINGVIRLDEAEQPSLGF